MHPHSLSAIPLPNWFDAATIMILLWGLNKGRKHGMSEELMVTLQWVAIIFAGAFLYRPLGDKLATSSPVSHLFCYIAIYVTSAIATKLAFAVFKKAIGGKLVGSDVFGGAEYYLGMVAGAIRYACMLIAALAILNAPYYSAQDIASARAYQDKEFGSNYFPELSGVQQTIFNESLIGNLIKQRAGILLIASTKTETVAIKRRKDDLP
ncbi:MAG: Colicin production protein [Pedosphaera sp.]|nr:Colicin production protein [Pedosphaera sp.]